MPVFGNMAELLIDPLAFFLKSYMTLGPVFRVEAPTRSYTVLAGMEATRFLVREDARVFDHLPLYRNIATELQATHYPIATRGERHTHMRRAIKPAFGEDVLAPHAPAILAEVRRRARGWAAGSRFVALPRMHELFGDVLAPALGGRPLGPLLGDAVRFARFSVGSGLGAYPVAFRHAPHYQLSRRRMMPFFHDLVAWHRAHPAGAGRLPDFFDHTLDLRDEGGTPLSDDNVVALAQMAYSNTLLYVAPAAAFMLYSLLSAPEALARVRAELDAALGHGDDFEALEGCAYFQAAKTESMRLHPIGLAAPRIVKEAFEFDGCRLEVGEAVLVAVSAAHYNPELYPEPFRFLPERHLPPRSESRAPGAYAPFGIGAHSCLGARLVDGMVALTVGAILHAVELELDPPGLTLQKRVNPFPEPTDDLVFRVVGVRGEAERAPSVTVAPSAVGRARQSALSDELRRESAQPLGAPRISGRHTPAARVATFVTDAWLDVSPAELTALVREADLGPLAGKLTLWETSGTADSPPWSRRVLYVSALPWPLSDRAFCIQSQVFLDPDGSVRIESASVPPDGREQARVGRAAWGSVAFSGYVIRPVSGGSRLTRVIEVDLALSLPQRLERELLRKVYADNHAWLERGQQHARSPAFAARVASDPMYARVREHVTAVRA
jgi:cytochrome P450